MTTTTEPRRRPPRAHPDAGRDLRLYLITLLALVYLVAWWLLWLPAARPTASAPPRLPPPDAAESVESVAPAAPAASRAPATARPVPVRAPERRVRRVRTRSS